MAKKQKVSHAEHLAEKVRRAPERGFTSAQVVASLKRITQAHWFSRAPDNVPPDVPDFVNACAGAMREAYPGNDGSQGARELVAEAVRLGLPARAAQGSGEAHGG